MYSGTNSFRISSIRSPYYVHLFLMAALNYGLTYARETERILTM